MPNESHDDFTLESPIYKGEFLWNDPFKEDVAGVLLSDKIASYAEKCQLVYPFDSKLLRPAEYTLRVGKKCYYDGKTMKVSKKKPVKIPSNGLVYIQIYEYFNLPYYLVARYSLRVKQVYRGLILDNGLQVDPGFHGHINVPVYNFTNEEKKLEYKEEILSVEFVKTTPFDPCPAINANEERDWVNTPLVNKEKKPLKIFQKKPDELYQQKTIPGFFKDGEKNESSVKYLAEAVDKFKKIQFWGGVGISAIILALIGYIYQTHDSFAQARIEAEKANSAVKLQQVEVEGKLSEIKNTYSDIELQTEGFEERLDDMEKLQNDNVKELQNRIRGLEAEQQNKKEEQTK